MLIKVQPPRADESQLTEPNAELTKGVYRGLGALVDVYEHEIPRRPDYVQFWRLVVERLHAVVFAPLWMANVIAMGLDDLAYYYDHAGWFEEAAGWRRVAKVVLKRAFARAGKPYPYPEARFESEGGQC